MFIQLHMRIMWDHDHLPDTGDTLRYVHPPLPDTGDTLTPQGDKIGKAAKAKGDEIGGSAKAAGDKVGGPVGAAISGAGMVAGDAVSGAGMVAGKSVEYTGKAVSEVGKQGKKFQKKYVETATKVSKTAGRAAVKAKAMHDKGVKVASNVGKAVVGGMAKAAMGGDNKAMGQGMAAATGTIVAASIAGKVLEKLDPGLYGPNFAGSFDVYSGPTTISVEEPQSLQYHHNRLGYEYIGNNPDAEMSSAAAGNYAGEEVPTPIRIAITAESPYQPQDLPLVAIKMFQPKSGKQSGMLKLTSPDVHTIVLPEGTFL